MVNIMGLDKADILAALSEEAGKEFEPLRIYKPIVPRPGCFGTTINGEVVIVDLYPDDGIDEFYFDRALGCGAMQRAIDKLKMEKGAHHEETGRIEAGHNL